MSTIALIIAPVLKNIDSLWEILMALLNK
jgi:hypothetical protein